MNVAGVSRLTARRFKTLTGKSFYGTMFTPQQRQDVGFDSPHQMMRVAGNSNVGPGEIFRNSAGRVYLIAEHTDYETPSFSGRSFSLLEMTQQVAWTRTVTGSDTVTGLPRVNAAPLALGTIWTSIEKPMNVTDELQVPRLRYELSTAAALQMGDFVGGKRVVQVATRLGVTHATVL